jgi:hypothetical protein
MRISAGIIKQKTNEPNLPPANSSGVKARHRFERLAMSVVGCYPVVAVSILAGNQYTGISRQIKVVTEFVEFGHAAIDFHMRGDNAYCETHPLFATGIWKRAVDTARCKDHKFTRLHLKVLHLLFVRLPIR